MNKRSFSVRVHWIQVATLVAWSLLLLPLTLTAQFEPKGRFEKEVKPTDNAFSIVSLKENGIALIREKNKYNSGKRTWELMVLGADLEIKWQSDVEIRTGYILIGYEHSNSQVCFLFRQGDRDSNEFILLSLNLGNFQTKQFEIKHEFLFRPTHFTIAGTNAIFGGYVSGEPAVILYDQTSQLLKVIPGFFLKDTELLDLSANTNNTFNALLIERKSLDKRHLVVKTFDEKGSLLLEDNIEIENNIHILTGISSGLKREELILVGTYTEGSGSEAIGYFSVLVNPFTNQSITYTPFASLNYLLDYLPHKRASRIKAKTKERIEIGKSPDYKAHVLPVRIEETEAGFYLLSEMYDPVSSHSNRNQWDNNYYNPYYGNNFSPYGYNPYANRYSNSPYSYNNSNQNSSSKMIESILTLFDEEGKLIWDASLKYDDIKRYATEQISDFTIKKDLISLSYKKENKIYTNTSAPNFDPELDTLSVPLKNSYDVLRNETEDDTGIRHWYGNYSFVWGYQSIRDTASGNEDPIRYVFYINKFEAE